MKDLQASSLNDELITNKSGYTEFSDNVKPYGLFFFLLGNASLLAFNIFIGGIGIYIRLTGEEDIGTTMNRVYNVPNALTALALCLWKPRNLKIVLTIGLGAVTVIMSILPILLLVTIDSKVQYYLTLTFMGLTGVVSSFIFSSSWSLASQFTSRSTTFVSSGNGACGVIAGVLRIITNASVKPGSKMEDISAAIYFFLAAAILGLTLVYFLFMARKPEIADKLISREETVSIFTRETLEVIKIIWPLWFAEFIDFMITLSVFPGYVGQASNVPKKLLAWSNVIVVFTFQVFDWVGRYLPSHFMWPGQKWAWLPVVCRFGFYVLFVMSLNGPWWRMDPWWTFALMIPFALSNGYWGTVCMVYGSNHSSLNDSQKKFAGFLMGFAINAGILTAVIGVSYAFPKYATKHIRI